MKGGHHVSQGAGTRGQPAPNKAPPQQVARTRAKTTDVGSGQRNKTPQADASKTTVLPRAPSTAWERPPAIEASSPRTPEVSPQATVAEAPRPAPPQLLTKRVKLGVQRPLGPLDRTGKADGAAADIQSLLVTLKQEQSAKKQALERKLVTKLNEFRAPALPAGREETPTEKQVRADREMRRGQLILNHGVALTKLGVNADLLKNDPRFTQLQKTHGLIVDNDTISVGGIDVFFLRSGAAAFDSEPILKAGGAIQRDVYRKFGKDQGKNNEYVKDDQGVFTRRYAYVEKSKYQLRELLYRGVVKGRYSSDPSSKVSRPYNTFDPKLRNRVQGLPANGTTFANSYQLAYVHQELGSGQEQRGVSATSTEKHAIFSNQGESFKTGDGVRFELDLARVPKGTAGKPQVFNHYAAEAQTKAKQENLSIIGNHPRDFVHYQKSTIKNRELFIQELRPEYLSRLTLHAAGDRSIDAPEAGFTLATLRQNVGNSGGQVDYSAGFKDWILKRANAQPSNPAYAEGRRDANKYTSGYTLGQAARAEASGSRRQPDDALANKVGYIKATDVEYKKQDAAENERWKQGFWDAYWDRSPREA